ncbi:MAG TPA: S8 family serine peptidase [Caulobacteraceae bacterium]|jgi:hypothetical protein
MARITINGNTIDPVRRGPQLDALALPSADPVHTDYILVQLAGPVTAAERQQLADVGCELLEFVPLDTYVAHYTSDDLGPVRALPFVVWAGGYMKGFKVHPAVSGRDPTSDSVATMAKEGAADRLRGQTVKVRLVLHKDVEPSGVYERIARAAGVNLETLPAHGRRIMLTVPTSRIKALADIDEVRAIEPAPKHSLFNNVAGPILRSYDLHAGVGGLSALDGDGQVVAVCDTGLDKGSTSDLLAAFGTRVLKIYDLGQRGVPDDPVGHGTHVCGSVLGDDTVAGVGRIAGSAPAAKLVMQSVLTADGGLGGLPANLGDLFKQVYATDGARVHSNSWGNSDPASHQAYDDEATQVDEFVHANPDMVICFAAGNDGSDDNQNGAVDGGSVSPPGTAKNCITVGASESLRDGSPTYGSLRPDNFPIDPLYHDVSANNPEGMAAFSSRGTTVDGRIKPDVVAPGTSILSTLSRAAQAETVFGISPIAGYMFDTGTSMATPLVSGCAALVRQHLIRDRGVAGPSAALVKAMLINGATPLKGQYVPSEAGAPPNADQGFGRVDVAASVDPGLQLHDEGAPLADTGAVQSFDAVTGPTGALKVTLVWTDPAGQGLQNDLDLVVSVGQTEAHGNVGAGSAEFDRLNNVEQVDLSGLAANAPAKVTVSAHRIALQGQRFALVIRKA